MAVVSPGHCLTGSICFPVQHDDQEMLNAKPLITSARAGELVLEARELEGEVVITVGLAEPRYRMKDKWLARGEPDPPPVNR